MSAPLGRRDFFALEAGEYLERLSVLVASPGQPDGDQFVRYARALRGAALMAGPPGYAQAAAAVENLAKVAREGTLAWTPILADRLADALEDCKALLRQVREWGDSEASRCERIARSIDTLAGGESRPLRPVGAGTGAAALTAGVRAFVARESAGVAAALDQIADDVDRRPGPNSAVPVMHRLQPLRGLGALPGLSPLPELLEALDLTLATGGRGGAWPPRAGQALRAVGVALARMARDIAELGMPQADSHEVVQATELLRESFASTGDVVPIGSLAAAGDPDPVVFRGSPPAAPAPPADPTVELVSLADRLRMSGGQLTEQSGGTTRALQLHSLVFALRGLVMSLGLRAAAGPFLDRFDREVMAGRAARAPERMAAMLRQAADAMVETAGTGDFETLTSALAPLLVELDAMAPSPEPEPVPIAALAPDEGEVVPIESLLYDAAVEPSRPHTMFERSFSTYFRLLRGEAAAQPQDLDVVPIDTLLYRGRRALERAEVVRGELSRALQVRRDLNGVETLLAELLDLVPLALADER